MARKEMERYTPWRSKAETKRKWSLMDIHKRVDLKGWQIKQKGDLWAIFRPKRGKK